MTAMQPFREHLEHLQLNFSMSLPRLWISIQSPRFCLCTCFSVFPVFRVFSPMGTPEHRGVLPVFSGVPEVGSIVRTGVRRALEHVRNTAEHRESGQVFPVSHREEHRRTPRTPFFSRKPRKGDQP